MHAYWVVNRPTGSCRVMARDGIVRVMGSDRKSKPPQYEVTEAFRNRTMLTGSKWTGTSPSGVVIEGYINTNHVTFYPTGTP
jgi:hypothetical protein